MRLCIFSVLIGAVLFACTKNSAMDNEIDFESSKKKIITIAFRSAGYTDYEITKFQKINPDIIKNIKKKANFENQGSTVGRIYFAQLENGGCYYCGLLRSTKKTNCQRIVQITQDPKLIIELPLKSSYYALIEKHFKNQAD